MSFAAPSSSPVFDFHPTYPSQPALDALCLKIDARLDDFPAETLHDRVSAILAEWRTGMLESPRQLQTIQKACSPEFLGCSLHPADSRVTRDGEPISVTRLMFSPNAELGPTAFLNELHFALSALERVVTAELQITRVEGDAQKLRTDVRYELVGTGSGFHREQRAGIWELEWSDFRLTRWRSQEETRSRSSAAVFTDTTAAAFGSNSSYAAQMLRGVDHWRTLLDSASGIDIYGHNGVSVGDINNDGFDDVYICQPAGLPNRLYRNRGDGTFEDVTEHSGVGLLDNTACALFADFDNDGKQDLVVVRAAGPLLFLNQGDGTFRLKPDAFHFAAAPQGTFTGAAVADYDRDGRIDIYFCLYVYYQGTGQYKYPTPYYDANNGPPNFLMHNNGDGTFRDVTATTGLDKNNTRFSFCCGWSDYNRDGWPDLYVVNDFGRKNLYRNNGDGTFTDVATQAGVDDVGAGMGVSWLDSRNSGKQDLYVADMWTAAGERLSAQPSFKAHSSEKIRSFYRKHAMGNSLFLLRPDGTFTDATQSARVGFGRWSWSCDAWDFDHDGHQDLYVSNGMLSGPLREDANSFFWRRVVANSPDEPKTSYDYEQGWTAINELIRADYSWSGFERNVFYANNRDGTFSDVSGAVGLDFVEDGRAFAVADFDHDGRQEMLLKNRNAPQIRLLRNEMHPLPPSIAFRLKGTKSNRDAIGALVTLGTQARMLQAGSGFLSQHSKEVFFGLGDLKGPVSATIRWPSGLVQQLHGLPPNHRVWVEEGAEPNRIEPFKPTAANRAAIESKPEPLPSAFAAWLLDPVPAPKASSFVGKPLLVTFTTQHLDPPEPKHLQVFNIKVTEKGDEASALYNLIYRYLFDRHRDMTLPVAFLLNEESEIVKVYQGLPETSAIEHDAQNIPKSKAERLAKALPFPGVSATYEFGRNNLSYGAVFLQHGYLDQAQASFSRALREDPTSAEASYGLGSIDLQLGNLRAARNTFEETLKLNATYPDTLANAWNNLGLIATRDGHLDEAVRCLQEALKRNPEHFIALENLGNAFRQEKRWDEARQTLDRALSLRPQDPEANYSIAMVYAQTDQSDKAYEFLQRALKSRPAYPEALNNLGVLYLRSRRRDDAVAQFEKCIRIDPDFNQSYLNLARVYSIEGAPDKARDVLREFLKRHPDDSQAKKALEQLQ